MKIVSAFELSEQVNAHDGGIIELEDTCFRGNLTIFRRCSVLFRFTDDSDAASVSIGNLCVQSSGVTIQGLRLEGIIQVTDSLDCLSLSECIIRGSVRIGQKSQNISLEKCVISSQRGTVGVSVSDGVCIEMKRCHVQGCVSGFALTQHATMGKGTDSEGTKWARCSFIDCSFEHNTVDILIDVYIHGGDVDDFEVAIPMDCLVSIGEHAETKIDVSLRGVFDKALQFKAWPLDRSAFPLTVARRGGAISGRDCFLRFDGENLIITQDLSNMNASTPRGRKRKQPEGGSHSKATLYYSRILEVEPGAAKSDILAAYRRLALRYHPDKNDDNGDRFILIKRARDELIRMIDN